MRITPSRRLSALVVILLVTWAASLAARWARVTPVVLPVEVVGEDGTMASVTVDVPAAGARDVRTLWMQVHGLSYAGMASIQVNSSAWIALSNDTASVAEPGRSYGGIGGGFGTLKLTVPLPANTVVPGANTIRFRFNHTDGVASGFRVVAFNFLASDATKLVEPDAFVQENPDNWTPPLTDPDSLRAGREAWLGATLTASALPDAKTIRAHCADCHAHDGRDLKYFNFSNASIAARSRFHGLTDLQGRQIASYVRSLPGRGPGRPWNPPYQPGPGLDARPVAEWAAGAGLEWALETDSETLPYLFGEGGITPDVFRPDGNLNPREIPIALQLPDWSHWLPRVHPIDAWGAAFQRSEFSKLYDGSPSSLRETLASPALAAHIASGRVATLFDKWTLARRTLLKPYVEPRDVKWTPELGTNAYGTQLWQLVKTWEMTQEYGLEGRGREFFGPTGEPRTWFNAIPAATAPAAVNIPDGPAGMGGTAVTNQYFDASWYELQVLVNSGNHRHFDRTPVDWVYVIGQFQNLYRESRRPEPARLLVALIKSMQSTDPRIGPADVEKGWRPTRTVDPAVVVLPAWAPMFAALPSETRRAVTESMLTAWLDKNEQYRVDRYFFAGIREKSYTVPGGYADIATGKPWASVPQLKAAGINPNLIARLQAWGASYSEMSQRFQYNGRGGGQ
jgi:hypothetical protein